MRCGFIIEEWENVSNAPSVISLFEDQSVSEFEILEKNKMTEQAAAVEGEKNKSQNLSGVKLSNVSKHNPFASPIVSECIMYIFV